MLKLVLGLAFVLTACGGGKQAAPAAEPGAPAPTSGAPMTPDECTAKGGYVKGDIGDGKVACTDGDAYLGRVAQGIEGAVCCVAAKP